MDAEIKQIWLKALRSGEYKQSTTVLHNSTHIFKRNDDSLEFCDGEGFCCLGVLANELYKREFSSLIQKDGDGFIYTVAPGGYKNESDIGPLLDTIKLHESGQAKLIEMNDNDHCTFEEIADHIEKYL